MRRRSLVLLASAALLSGILTTNATTDGYSIGLNFGSDEVGGELTSADIAGIPGIEQKNWNNMPGANGANPGPVVSDNAGTAADTEVYVEWSSNGTWASTGRGEENNGFPTGPDRALMTGYLDTGNATTTTIMVLGLPENLTSSGYDVYIYGLGGVSGRGGGYRILNSDDSSVLRTYKLGDSPLNPSTYIEDPGVTHTDTGNYLVFRSLEVPNIIIEATTADGQGGGGTPRAPVNAIQFVEASGEITITGISGTPVGFAVTVEDSITRTLDPENVSLTLDGSPVAAANVQVTKSGVTSTITFSNPSAQLVPGSTHEVVATLRDSTGATVTETLTFTVPDYTVVPAEYAVDAANTSEPGFNIRTVQLPAGVSLPNTTQAAETLLAGKFIDPNTEQPAVNMASPANSTEAGVINYNIDAPLEAGNFTAATGQEDKPFPGIPGTEFETQNFAMEALTYLNLAAGAYTMGVNSDDGFKVTVAPSAPDVAGITLGEFSGGRAAADTLFNFVITESGVYPFRLIFEQGAGGASLEWFLVVNGQKVLINDPAAAGSVLAYRSSTGATRPFVSAVSPISGSVKVAVDSPVSFTIQNGTVQVDANSIELRVNGETQTPVVTSAGGTTTVAFQPAGGLQGSTDYTVELTYADTATPALTRAATISFTTERVPNQLPPLLESDGLVVIEAENFDAIFDRGGKSWTFGNSIPGYAGDGYMQALPDVDSGTPNDPSTIPTDAPELEYKVQFTNPGTYYVWVRGYGPSGGSDSLHVGFNDEALESSIRITGFNQTFSWRRGRQEPSAGDPTVEVPSAGEHVVNVWMREDGTIVDRVLLTSDPGYVPSEPGPSENLRIGQVAPTVSISAPAAGARFAAGSNISITADAAVEGATITKVEFFANGVKIGESAGPAFNVSFDAVPEGRYRLTAAATTSQGVTRSSAAVDVIVGNPPDQILYVNAAGGPNASDNAIIDRLESFGFEVISVGGPDSKTGDATGKVLVVLSSTINSGDVTTKFSSVAVPVINWEQALQDDLLMTGDVGDVDRGGAGGQTELVITDASHPLAAGLSAGTHAVVTTADSFSWGVPAPTASLVAELDDGLGRGGVYGYDTGDLLIDGTTTAPARRVMLFLGDNTFLQLTEAGRSLVDAAFSWALDRDLTVGQPELSIARAGADLLISWSGGGTLQATPSLTDPQWTDVSGDSSVSVQPTGDMRFFRVVR